jgi:metal-responsive CopG/Arc/MetJ family transcriptional regulator
MPQSLVDEIDAELTYGDSRSEFTRGAIRLRVRLEQEHGIEFDEDFVVEAVRENLGSDETDETDETDEALTT